jgi:hypothetical protein
MGETCYSLRLLLCFTWNVFGSVIMCTMVSWSRCRFADVTSTICVFSAVLMVEINGSRARQWRVPMTVFVLCMACVTARARSCASFLADHTSNAQPLIL